MYIRNLPAGFSHPTCGATPRVRGMPRDALGIAFCGPWRRFAGYSMLPERIRGAGVEVCAHLGAHLFSLIAACGMKTGWVGKFLQPTTDQGAPCPNKP
jgi:hypothetical protein